MHELSLMQAAIAATLAQANAHGARWVHRVVLHVGEFSGAEPDALRFAFPVVAQGTAAEGADLAIEIRPGRELCLAQVEMS